jgi:phosphate transport system permease protein
VWSTPRRATDVAGRVVAWASGGVLIAIFGGMVGYLAYKGVGHISWSFLTKAPNPGNQVALGGGILDPIVGTLILAVLGTLIALPLGVAVPIFLAEYRRPAWLARGTEIAVEVIFGVPSIVFAIFGIALFTNPSLVFLSSGVASSNRAFGKSFLVAGVVMSLLALPPIIRSTQEALSQVPWSLREASWALGKTRATTIRRLLLPESRRGFVTGIILGLGRIAGDTAIVLLLLGGTLGFGGSAWWHPGQFLNTLRGSGTTLTAYIYNASPAGELSSTGKADGAAFVLILVILLLNGFVVLASRRFRWKKQS